MKRRNPVTGKIEHLSYWANRPKVPKYRMDRKKATEIKGRPEDDGGEPQPSPPS